PAIFFKTGFCSAADSRSSAGSALPCNTGRKGKPGVCGAIGPVDACGCVCCGPVAPCTAAGAAVGGWAASSLFHPGGAGRGGPAIVPCGAPGTWGVGIMLVGFTING